MDRTNVHPRYFVGRRQNSDEPASASSHQPVTVVLREQQQIREMTAGLTAPAISLDFEAGARAYKKTRTRNGALRGLKIATSISVVVIVVVGGFGFWLNNKYAGRALPFSYVGGISVGGLTQSEVKAALDNHVKDLKVTLVDGGLTRTVPASTFGAKFDTETASKQIIPDFNPFAFLDRRSIDVPVTINDNQVDGYLRINVQMPQTKPVDAHIVKEKTKLIVKPQVVGFRTDPSFVAERIRTGLASMQSPVINVNAATLKPKVAVEDLTDDVIKANKLLATNVTISYGRSVNVITSAQKLAWIQFENTNSNKDIQISFSRTLVRQYVADLAKKYQAPVEVKPVSDDPNAAAAPATPRVAIENIEEVTDSIVAGLSSGQATSSTFVAAGQQKPNQVSVLSTTNR